MQLAVLVLQVAFIIIMQEQHFLTRYQAGEHVSVWEELQSLGEIKESVLRDDALAVARETIRRVYTNLGIIVHRLTQLGFESKESNQVLVQAKPNATQLLNQFEQQWGILPFSVRAWYECVHSFNLFASKPLCKSLIKSIDLASIAVSFSSYENLYDDISHDDELHWYIKGITFLSLEESLSEVCESRQKFKQDWEQGKVDSWTRNYYLEHGLESTISSININFLPVGMPMSTCEPMGFRVGSPLADCILHDDGLEVSFVDFLREQLLFGGLLYGHCAKNNQYNYLYIGKLPNHAEVAGEVIKELLPF
jgi:hypothetical protein